MYSIIKEEVDMVTNPVNISSIISVARVSQEEGVEDRDFIFNSVKVFLFQYKFCNNVYDVKMLWRVPIILEI